MSRSSTSSILRIDPVHTAVKGRVRVRVPALYRNPVLQQELPRELGAQSGIRAVTASALTGTLLIQYDAALGLAVILRAVARAADEVAARPSPRRERPPAAAAIPPSVSGPPWHELKTAEVLRRLDTSAQAGLTADEARARLRRYGRNVLAQPHPPSALRVFLAQLKSLPVLLLLGSSAVSILTGGLADAGFILAVVVLNASVGTATEMRSEKTIASLTRVAEPHATVIRDGGRQEISAAEVVPGDLLVLARGRAVPADARLLSVDGLTIDESVLTGESLPVTKQAKAITIRQRSLASQRNMAFRDTVVTGGSGLAVVVATGAQTQIGRIQSLMLNTARPPTPIEEHLDALGRRLVLLTSGIAGLVLVLGRLRGFGWLEMLKTSVSLAIAAVPEGLPAVATSSMAWGIWRLRQQGVLVRHLAALESLGGMQVLCLDKTGTITMNRMSVVAVIAGGRRWAVGPEGLQPQGGPPSAAEQRRLESLAQAVALCNEAGLYGNGAGNGAGPGHGNGPNGWNDSSTEGALLRMASLLPLDLEKLRQTYPLRTLQRRTESRPVMTTLHDGPDGMRLLVMKGSPRQVLQACRWVPRGRGRVVMTARQRREVEAANRELAGQSLRVLGVAWQPIDAGGKADPAALTWLGLVALADPPRLGMPRLMMRLHGAGIRTVMITGDQQTTAAAIGDAIGLNPDIGLNTRDFDRLIDAGGGDGEDEFDQAVLDTDVFARVNPTDKLRIVQALQRRGQVVGMTGDGVNDGPALRAADVGIAMGRAGTGPAREVADVVLLEDDPRAILAALREGRAIQKNIRTSVHYLVATNFSEVLLVLGCIGVGLGQPLSPRQLLWINLLTDVLPALALAVQPPEPRVLRRPPPSTALLGPDAFPQLGRQSAVISGSALASYLYGVRRFGAGMEAGTLAFLSLTTAQLLHTLSAASGSRMDWRRAGRTGWIGRAIAASLALETLALVVPPLRALLGISIPGALDLVVCLSSAAASLLINEAFKVANGKTSLALPPASNQGGPAETPPSRGYHHGNSGTG